MTVDNIYEHLIIWWGVDATEPEKEAWKAIKESWMQRGEWVCFIEVYCNEEYAKEYHRLTAEYWEPPRSHWDVYGGDVVVANAIRRIEEWRRFRNYQAWKTPPHNPKPD